MTDLDTLGGTQSRGNAVNRAGQVVGYVYVPGNGATHSFLYVGTPGVDGHMIDLDKWFRTVNPAAAANWSVLDDTYDLTDAGLIVGRASYYDGPGGLHDSERLFLLDASSLVPEPGAMAVLIVGALPLLRYRGRRRPTSSSVTPV
jgi:probable HAF family extracellular repeat protein